MTAIPAASTDLKEHRKRRRATAREVAYETSGPGKLARQPARMSLKQRMPNQEWLALRQHLESRLNMLRSWRTSWMMHFQLLENFILPRRGIFINTSMPTPNTMIRGIPINQNIVDETGTIAMRRCAAGLMSNETRGCARLPFTISAAMAKSRHPGLADLLHGYDRSQFQALPCATRTQLWPEQYD